jgi:hypothetical protein
MKRYRVLSYDFDSRALILREKPDTGWDPKVREQWNKNVTIIREDLLLEFGLKWFEQKEQNFIDLGPTPFSIIGFHNKFFRQIRYAFVNSAYYPALVASCALGERILNHLVLALREDFRTTAEYKKVYRKNSFDNWDLAIDTLGSWGVLLTSAVEGFKELHKTRVESIHFRPEIDRNERELALLAINQLARIIKEQFSGLPGRPWFITEIPGAAFVTKASEQLPFVKKIVLPNCVLVGPYHRLEFEDGKWKVIDDYHYECREISDEDFSALYKNTRNKPLRKAEQ